MRERFNENPVVDLLTRSDYIHMVEEEPIILHFAAHQLGFDHWAEHLFYFWLRVSGQPPEYKFKGDFELLKNAVYESLHRSGFLLQAEEVFLCKNEEELNESIIRQYTEPGDLYKHVLKELRTCHHLQIENPSDEYLKKNSSTLAEWILQLNTAIRRQPQYEDISYRGAVLNPDDIAKYTVGDVFIWAPFISASMAKDVCLDGNVLFEIVPDGTLTEHDKCYARDISNLSIFPDEKEVLFPLACGYKVDSKHIDSSGKTVVRLICVDYY